MSSITAKVHPHNRSVHCLSCRQRNKSCTVYSASGLISDALSTAFFVMGEEKAAEFYEKYNIAEYIITRNDGTVSVSDGISADFKAS